MSYILTDNLFLVFKNVFLIWNCYWYKIRCTGSLIKMCNDIYIQCLIRHFFFFFELYQFYRKNIVRVLFDCSILQNKHLTCTENTEMNIIKYVYICIYVCTYILHAYIYIYIYSIYVCMYIYINIYIYIYI